MKTILLPRTGTHLVAFRRKPNKEVVHGVIIEDSAFPFGRAIEVAGRRFATLSEASTAITGYSSNGWRWWKNADGSSLKRETSA